MRLASHNGITLQKLYQEWDLPCPIHPHEELDYWLAFDELEPIGQTWLHTGMICSAFVKAMNGEWVDPTRWIPSVEQIEKAEKLLEVKRQLAAQGLATSGRKKK